MVQISSCYHRPALRDVPFPLGDDEQVSEEEDVDGLLVDLATEGESRGVNVAPRQPLQFALFD